MHQLHLEDAISKEQRYQSLLPQLKALLEGETNAIANMANFAAALKEAFAWWWVGFYLIQDNQLVLGPFQGPVACTRIAKGKGVCGSAWEKNTVLIVKDVDQFPGHIACSAASKSEIVLPFYDKQHNCLGVLDVDSEFLAHFDETDATYLKQLLELLNL